MSYCRYGVQLPTEKISGKRGPQNETYAEVYTIQPCRKKSKTELEQTDIKGDSSGEVELKQNVDNLNKSIKHDHDYTYVCDCVENCICSGRFKKQKVIDRLQLELEGLKTENALLRRQATKGRNVVDKFLKTDAKIRTYTGLPSKKTFNNLVKYVTQKSKKLRYWSGSKKAISTKVRRNFKTSPKETGPQRKLSVKEELTVTTVRTAVTNEMLADLFDISTGGASQVINTWVKFLACELKPLIFWPSKEAIRESLPKSLKHYTNLRCTIDCSEILLTVREILKFRFSLGRTTKNITLLYSLLELHQVV